MQVEIIDHSDPYADFNSGPYGAIAQRGGSLPPGVYDYDEVASAYGDTEPEPEASGLPADVLESLKLPEKPVPEVAPAAPAWDLIEGFKLDLPRGGWVQFGSVLDIPNSVRTLIKSQITTLTQRIEQGKASGAEINAVDDRLTLAMLAVVVTGWSYPVPCAPMRRDALDHLPALVVDRLSEVAGEYTKLILSRQGGNEGSETDTSSPRPPSAG